MTKLTSKQQRVLEFLQRYFLEHRLGPFIREIQEQCEIASYKSTVDRLNALERKGYIKRAPNKHRGIKLTVHREAQRQLEAVSAVNAPGPSREEPMTPMDGEEGSGSSFDSSQGAVDA